MPPKKAFEDVAAASSASNGAESEQVLKQRTASASAAFARWNLKKSRLDRGLQLLLAIPDSRLEDEESEKTYEKVNLAMVATDLSMSFLSRAPKGVKTLKKAFYSWCLKKFKFRNLLISEKDLAQFTEGQRVQFDKKPDPSKGASLSYSGKIIHGKIEKKNKDGTYDVEYFDDSGENEKKRIEKGVEPRFMILRDKNSKDKKEDDLEKDTEVEIRYKTYTTASYLFAAKKGKSDNAKIALRKALNADQIQMNKCFTAEFNRRWNESVLNLYELAEKEFGEGRDDEEREDEKENGKGKKGGKEESKEPGTPKKSKKGGDDEEAKTGEDSKEEEGGDDEDPDSDPTAVDDEKVAEAKAMNAGTFQNVSEKRWQAFLYSHGIAILEKMQEEDEDVAKKKAADNQKEKDTLNSQAYERFVRRKDRNRVRMPDEPERVIGGQWKPPRLDFGMGKPLVRSKRTAIPKSTIDIMRGSGLKYVHALNGASDVLKCRKQLLEEGWVFKENFYVEDPGSDDDEDAYKKEKDANKASKLKEMADRNRQKGSKMSFDMWRIRKEMCEMALKALQSIDRPSDVSDEEVWFTVGKKLKAIDRNLYPEWVKWTGDFKSAYKCQVLWDFFPPKCCDVHSASYSGIRETFLKLLRPGLNYKSVFELQCRRKWSKWEREAADRKEPADPVTYIKHKLKDEMKVDTKDCETKEEIMDKFELDKDDMRAVVRDLGVKMEPDEFRRLIDAFDVNRVGTVSKKKFLDFVCPIGEDSRPNVRGDLGVVLERKCVYESTCRCTGMPNAFVITTSMLKEGEKAPSLEEEKRRETSLVKIVVKDDNRGDGRDKSKRERRRSVRRVYSLEEREKRWKILKSFGKLIKIEDLKEHDEENFDDEEEHCQTAEWDKIGLFDREGEETVSLRVTKQKEALEKLMELSKNNRAALTLKRIMDKGSPPPAPSMWAETIGSKYVLNEIGAEYDALTDQIVIGWRAQRDSLVAFVSLEMSGPMGSKAQQNNEFTEIYRDPPCADDEPEFHCVIGGSGNNSQLPDIKIQLEPNTTYSFRMRAFNGFGPGPYVRGDFTTRPAAPLTPVLVSSSLSTVAIRWKFGSKNNQNFIQLRKAFEKMQIQSRSSSSFIPRPDFLLFIERSNPDLMLFLRGTLLTGNNNEVSIFDAIESHDDDKISFAEIEYYQQLVSTDEDSSGFQFTRTKYVVEQCVSQRENEYKTVWKGSAGEAMIKGLEPGSSYRFRVHAINVDGVRGAPSYDVIVNTLLEAPIAPKLSGSSRTPPVGATNVNVWWPVGGGRDQASNQRVSADNKGDPKKLDKLLAAWTGSASNGAEDVGVSLDMIFSQYVRDKKSSSMDGSDLLSLLQDLGVQPSEESLRDAWQELDKNRDSSIKFSDFESWWTSKKITYVLKRSSGAEKELLQTICYRGSVNHIDVTGLMPNTAYSFQLKMITPNSFSMFSKPFEVITAPLPPKPPVVVATNNKEVILKLSFGDRGGHKFCLQRKFIKAIGSSSANPVAVKKACEEGWVAMYEGNDPLIKASALLPSCIYQFRAYAANKDDLEGGMSEAVNVTTREKKLIFRASNAPQVFTIECTGDVVTGDLILFTERLFTRDGKLVSGGGGNGMTVKVSGGVSTPRLSISDGASLSSRDGVRGSGHRGEFAGERTVAARVLSRREGGVSNTGKVSRKTTLRLECAWSSVNDTKKCGEFLLDEGAILERDEDHIFNFETFRACWDDEDLRAKTKDGTQY